MEELGNYAKNASTITYSLNKKISPIDYENAIEDGFSLIHEASCKFTSQEINQFLGKDAKSLNELLTMIQRQLQVNNELDSSFSNNNNLSQNISHSNQALQNRIDAIKLIINN